MKIFKSIRAPAFAAVASLLAVTAIAAAQGFTLKAPTYLQGLLRTQGVTPTATGCTVATGSTDTAGSCTATAAAGTIVFALTTLGSAPFCIVVDASATPVMVYTVTALQITLTTITSTHIIRWHCEAQGTD